VTTRESAHFKGKDPVVQAMYDKLLAVCKRFGPVTVEPKQTSIHFVSKYAFAGVYTRSNYIRLELHLSKPLTSDRVTKIEQASANRFHHTIKILSVKEINAELTGWLHDAYQLKA
jgi:hypothetical protein